MKVFGFFLGMALAISTPALAFDSADVVILNEDTTQVYTQTEAKWFAMAAGSVSIGSGSGPDEQMAIWLAMRDCEKDYDDCDAFHAIELSSTKVIAIGYCADGYYNTVAGVGSGMSHSEAKAAALAAAKESITTLGYEPDEGEETEEDPSSVVMACKAKVFRVMQSQ